jgi:hypothetical protein
MYLTQKLYFLHTTVYDKYEQNYTTVEMPELLKLRKLFLPFFCRFGRSSFLFGFIIGENS